MTFLLTSKPSVANLSSADLTSLQVLYFNHEKSDVEKNCDCSSTFSILYYPDTKSHSERGGDAVGVRLQANFILFFTE
jgi:hypothetical protein